MTNTAPYFLQITKNPDDTYQACLHKGDWHDAIELGNLHLQPDSQITIKGEPYSLAHLVNGLIQYDENYLQLVFDARGQLEIGQYLFAQTFGKLESARQNQLLQSDKIHVRVLCPDEHIASLPWVLLANKGIFLSAENWTVALAETMGTTQIELPPFPKILIIAPQPNGAGDTEAPAHIDELQDLLLLPEHVKNRLQIASTWEDFKTRAKSLQPEIVYYYGHGNSDGYATELLFADNNQQLCQIAVADFAQVLRKLQKPPKLAYINCCQGDAGGWLGVGRQLGNFIPAVITNHTVAQILAARAQAQAFWHGLLIEGLTPDEAVAGMRNRLVEDGLSFSDVRWMTPVLHCHYQSWKTTRPSPTSSLERDPHWRVKLDRLRQMSEIFYQLIEMTNYDTIPAMVFIWYGQPGQGVEIFHERLELELQDKLAMNNTFMETIKPTWADDFEQPYRSFADMYREWFGVQPLEEIPSQLQKPSGYDKTLLYVCHQPITPSYINTKILKAYLKWWDNQLIPHLNKANIYGLLGISFLTTDTTEFATQFSAALESLSLSNTVFKLLEELGNVPSGDLDIFLKFHKIPVPAEDKKRLLNHILQKTAGHYEQTLEALKALAEREWYFDEDE